MSREEEERLCELWAHGDIEAKEALFIANMGLIGMIIKDYRISTGIDYEDLFSEGALGLWRGIELYEVGKGAKLSSYCQHWIHSRIKKALELQTRVIRVPRYLVQRGIKHLKAKSAIESELNRELKLSELERFNAANMRGKAAAEACISCESLDCEDEDGNLIARPLILEQPSASDNLELSEMLAKLPLLLKQLNPKLRRVIKQRFGVGCKQKTLEAIANEEGVTREWVRQLEKGAILELRALLIKAI